MNNKLNIRIGEKDAYRYQQPTRHKAAFPPGIVLLAALLLILAALSGIAAWKLPSRLDLEHPWVKRLCTHLSCEWLQPPPSYRAVRLKDMRLIQRGSTLVFDGRLVNEAHPLPWPVLHLSLYGIEGRNQYRYRLLARDYLREAAPPKMEPAEYAVWFSVENPGAAVSYSVEFKPLSAR